MGDTSIRSFGAPEFDLHSRKSLLSVLPYRFIRLIQLRGFEMLKRIFSPSSGMFKTRSADRDSATDQGAVLAIAKAIDLAIETAAAERSGLKRRMDDVISRAAIVGGNEIEEYRPHPDARSDVLHKADLDIRAGEARLLILDSNVSSFLLLRTELQSRFPAIALDLPMASGTKPDR
jgi:hypothetical protein